MQMQFQEIYKLVKFEVPVSLASLGPYSQKGLTKTDLTSPYNHNKIFQECVMIVRLS
jgi:hypothetical protein